MHRYAVVIYRQPRFALNSQSAHQTDPRMLYKSVHNTLRLHGRQRSCLPDYVRNKTPLLCAPRASPPQSCALESKRTVRASLITGIVVILPLSYLAYSVGDFAEFCEIVTILPIMPILWVACEALPFVFGCIQTLWPGIIIVVVAGFVFLCAYAV